MKLQAKPRPEGESRFFKFENIGDTLRGVFVQYEMVDGQYGPKPELTLRTKEGPKTTTCSTHLAQLIGDNVDKLKGMVLTIKLVGTKAVGKGNPMKIFEVDASPPNAKPQAPPVRETHEADAEAMASQYDDSDIPF